ncbi:MAG: hypothetical protein LBT92_03630 [Rickettsiales bacterium]|jgi:hypothetical protein|nr:hypothetical protein [Rickettsiales bacterium]
MTLETILYLAATFAVTELYWRNALKSAALNPPNKALAANALSYVSMAVALAIYYLLINGAEFASGLEHAGAVMSWPQSIVLLVSLYRVALPAGKKGRK